MPPILLAALAFSAVSSPPACRGVLAFAPPTPRPRPDAAPAGASPASTAVSSSRNDFYPRSSDDEDGRGSSGRDWNEWDDEYFDAGLPLSQQPYQPPLYSQQQQQQQPRAASSASGSGSRPFARSNANDWSTPQYSAPSDTPPPPSTWTNERQRQYREGKFHREAAWPQRQAYRGYNRPSTEGPVGRRAALAAGASYDRISGSGRDGGLDAPYGDRPPSRLLSPSAARSNVGRRGDSMEGYKDVASRQGGDTEDFRERSSRPSSNGPTNAARGPSRTGKEVGFGRRDSSFDVTAAATRGTGFGGDEGGYLDQIREERRREREIEKDRWERPFLERGSGNVDVDDERDTFNVLGESRRMLDDLSGPRRTSAPPPPPPLSPPPPYRTGPPTLSQQPRRGPGVGEGDAPAVRRGSKGGGARRGLPSKAQYVYETDLRPGDYGRPIDDGPGDGRGRPPPPPSLSEMAGGTMPSSSRQGDFGRFAGGAGYRYYDDGTQPSAKQRSTMSSTAGPDGFGRDAGGAGYRYYDNPSSTEKPRGSTKGGNGVGDRREENRYAPPRPPSPLEGNTYTEDFEDADDYSRRTRGAAPDGGPPFDEKGDRFEGRSAQERADGAFDRRRRLSRTSFGGASTGLDATYEPTVRQSSLGQRPPPPPPPSTFGGGRDDVVERSSSRPRADRSFDRPRTRSPQSFGQGPQSTFGASGGDLGDSASSQQRADRSFDRRRSTSQQSFGDARDDDVALDRRMPNERTDDRPYESKLLSKVRPYPPARRSSGTGASQRDTSKPQLDFGLDGIKRMVDKILSPYAEDGGAFAVDRMMGRVNSDIDRSIVDEKRWIKALLADARGFLLADAMVRDMLGGAITLGKPLSKSASSTMVGDVTKARLQLVIPITGSEGKGRIRLEANQDEIERLELEAEGRVIDVRLDSPGGTNDVLDADVYTFPNSGD